MPLNIRLVLLKNYISYGLTQYRAGDKIQKNEMGGACGPYGGRERSVQGAGGETRGEETAGETQA